MQAARAYLAGVGSTGSLLAVAALVFIVASALVAFHGWPHVAAQQPPGEVVISPVPRPRMLPLWRAGWPSSRRLRLPAPVPVPVGEREGARRSGLVTDEVAADPDRPRRRARRSERR